MVMDTSHEPDLDEERNIAQLHFGLKGMESYYLSFHTKWTFTEEAWAIMTGDIPQEALMFEALMWLDLVCTQLIPSKSTTYVAIEVAILTSCIMIRIHINVGEVISEQFLIKARDKATSLPFPILISQLSLRDGCPCFRPSNITCRVEEVFHLAAKRDKDGPSIKKIMLTSGLNSSPTPEVNAEALPLPPRNILLSTIGLLKIAHMARIDNAQEFNLAKVIFSMITHAIKVTMESIVYKLGNLCGCIDTLKSNVTTLREEME
ncbi:hypothetical protein HAX54_017111 [Datura stramonium]|uniref:Putative plant transposon protein domain-containing protein n=1 Tax=Datura stramonium TaxID=4076 RepID=A0ABS8UMD1_DATST|nr:hypothetical protein [Datura stramonium]